MKTNKSLAIAIATALAIPFCVYAETEELPTIIVEGTGGKT